MSSRSSLPLTYILIPLKKRLKLYEIIALLTRKLFIPRVPNKLGTHMNITNYHLIISADRKIITARDRGNSPSHPSVPSATKLPTNTASIKELTARSIILRYFDLETLIIIRLKAVYKTIRMTQYMDVIKCNKLFSLSRVTNFEKGEI